MSFFRYKNYLYPLFALTASVLVMVFGLVTARTAECSYFLLGAYVWLALFGCLRSCVRVLPVYIVAAGIFSAVAYLSSGRDPASALAMANRFGAVFVAVIPGMSILPAAMCRTMSQLHTPRAVTLGTLITLSFAPVLRAEIRRVREAMRTRGAGSVLNPKIFYRAFLVPFVMRLAGISDTLALSVETRGFALGKVKYTVYKKESVTLSDVVFLLGLIAGALLAVML